MNTANITNLSMESLKDFNEQSLQYRVPALVFLGFMLAVGILGNASAIYIYGFRLKTSNVHLFITLLAVSDIVSCLVSIPMEIYRMYFFYDFSSNATCKSLGFFAFGCSICSALLLLTIAVERYVKVCRSTKTQMSRTVAKVLGGAVFLIASLLTIPLPMYAVSYFYSLEDGTIVRCCIFQTKPALSLYWYIFFSVLISFLVVIFVLYWHVLKTAKEHATLAQQRKAGPSNTNAIGTSQKTEKAKNLSRTNQTVVWISVVYVASLLPIFIIALVMTRFKHLRAPNPIDSVLFLVFQAWCLNCTLNPVVYGFLNSKFRAEFQTLLTLKKSRKPNLNVS